MSRLYSAAQAAYTYIKGYFTPANLDTLGSKEIKLLDDYKKPLRKITVFRDLISLENYYQTQSEDTGTRDFSKDEAFMISFI